MLMVSMFYGLDENPRQVESWRPSMGLYTGLWLLILTLSNTKTLRHLQHHPEGQICPGPESEPQSES